MVSSDMRQQGKMRGSTLRAEIAFGFNSLMSNIQPLFEDNEHILDGTPARWVQTRTTLSITLGRGRRLRAANQLRVNRTALPFSHPHVTPQSQSLPSNRFVRFTL
ncbi:hypothetical protein J6590_053739 [Homalodisca vitripennis]|nr:hypothetical protein J6590_053739 [Homalodisca vitripennis]